MSPEPGKQPLTPATPSSSPDGEKVDIVKDLVLWRRKKLSATVVIAATATWVLMQVYQFNFLTVMSWVTMFVFASVFLWANLCRLLGKEPPTLLWLQLTEETALGMAKTVRAWIEEGIRWMFRVSADEQWPVFVRVVAGLWLLSYVASYMHLLTFLYIGIIAGMTVPVIFVKHEDKIMRFMALLREKCTRSYETIDEKVIEKIRSKVVNQSKGKKTQ